MGGGAGVRVRVVGVGVWRHYCVFERHCHTRIDTRGVRDLPDLFCTSSVLMALSNCVAAIFTSLTNQHRTLLTPGTHCITPSQT